MLILILLLVDHIDLKLNGKVENLSKVMDRLKAYWNMEHNSFSKEIVINKMYKTEDFKEAITRLEFLEKTREIGLFTGVPGTGKTYTIKFFLENLNPGLYKIIYLPLTSVSVIDFYRALCIELNLEPKGSKTKMFYEIQENIKKIVKEQKNI